MRFFYVFLNSEIVINLNHMKHIFLTIMVLCCLSCEEKNKIKAEPSEEVVVDKNFDWLIGNWERTNEKEGKQTFENWVKINKDKYQGLGFTMKDKDTIWKETISMIKVSGTWNFEVKGKADSLSTVFIVTEIDESSFICENKENEFPKKIGYSKSEKGILAVISGGDMEIPFEFEPFNMN